MGPEPKTTDILAIQRGLKHSTYTGKPTCRHRETMAVSKSKIGPQIEPILPTLDLELSASRTMGNSFLLLELDCLFCFVTSAWADQYIPRL
jgi:hypothetical protein